MSRPPAAVATLGRLTELDAKMAHGILRYCDNVIAVIDPVHRGRRLAELLPYVGQDLPIVPDVAAAAELGAEEIVIGAAPPGGAGGADVLAIVADALRRGLWVVHGLHTSFADAPGVEHSGERLVELRHTAPPDRVASGAAASMSTNVVMTVGSDCASGKMTSALEAWRGLRAGGRSANFVATGQTGMYIAGSGAPIDAIRSDFAAGVVEQLVLDAADAEFVIVEGQGSILHPAYSGVTLSLLHGGAPNLLIFCHELGRSGLAYFDRAIDDLAGQIELLERLARAQRPATVIALAVMARTMAACQARDVRADLAGALGLPVFDSVGEAQGVVDLLQEFA